MSTTDKSYSGYAGRLEGFLNYIPHYVVFRPEFENISAEERIKMSKALEEFINKELPRLQEVRP